MGTLCCVATTYDYMCVCTIRILDAYIICVSVCLMQAAGTRIGKSCFNATTVEDGAGNAGSALHSLDALCCSDLLQCVAVVFGSNS